MQSVDSRLQQGQMKEVNIVFLQKNSKITTCHSSATCLTSAVFDAVILLGLGAISSWCGLLGLNESCPSSLKLRTVCNSRGTALTLRLGLVISELNG